MCDFCKKEKKFSWGAWSEVRIEGKELIVYSPEDDDIHVDKFPIKYCPMCGENLNDYGAITDEEIDEYGSFSEHEKEIIKEQYAKHKKGTFPNPRCALY